MKKLTLLSGCSVLLSLVLALSGAWKYWKDGPTRDAWVLYESEQIITDLVPMEIRSTSFHLRNTTRVPRRIVGVYTC